MHTSSRITMVLVTLLLTGVGCQPIDRILGIVNPGQKQPAVTAKTSDSEVVPDQVGLSGGVGEKAQNPVEPVICGSDAKCIDALIAACTAGSMTENSGFVDLTYTVEGKGENGCRVTLKYANTRSDVPLSGRTLTCDFPPSVVDLITLNKHFEVLMKNSFAGCSGSVKDYYVGGGFASDMDKARESAQMQMRDSKRVSDLKQLQTALELYFVDQNQYPSGYNVIMGSQNAACLNVQGWQSVGCANANAYMVKVPSDPLAPGYYRYSLDADGRDYKITAKLEGERDGLRGVVTLTSQGIK